jgi:hypothetical protein
MELNDMINLKNVTTVITLSSTLVFAGAALAGKGNGKEPAGLAKHGITLEQTINSNAGIGNGGERKRQENWIPTRNGEDGGQDVDPGNSGDNNNACPTPEGDRPADTDC